MHSKGNASNGTPNSPWQKKLDFGSESDSRQRETSLSKSAETPTSRYPVIARIQEGSKIGRLNSKGKKPDVEKKG